MGAKINQGIIAYKGRYNPIEFYIEGASNLIDVAIFWAMGETATSSKLIEKTNFGGSPGITVDGLVVKVHIHPSDLLNIAAGKYYHELKFIDLDANPIQGASGEVDLKDTIID